jgi:hypothetical protein
MRRTEMKDILSVVAFVMKALCFVLFLIALRPDALSAVTAQSKPAHAKWRLPVRRDALASGMAKAVRPRF